jgi:hypothetical protein
MLDFLDLPRQSLWNIGSGLAEGDFSKALPGLLGVAGAAGLGMTGVGIPLAVLGGSALGGLGQNLFGADAPSSDQFANQLGLDTDTFEGKAGSFALNMATDPLSFAGMGLGSKLGQKAGASIGKGLESAAIQRGPRYGTQLDDLLKTFPTEGVAAEEAALSAGTLNEFRGTPQLSAMLREIPEGSRYLGGGAEGTAFRTPSGDVSRIGLTVNQHARPIDDMILQPLRSVAADAGVTSGPHKVMMHAERLPFAEKVGDSRVIMAAGNAKPMNLPLAQRWKAWTDEMTDEAAMRQLDIADLAPRNWGVQGGKPKIIDPGSVDPRGSYAGGFNPLVDSSQQPGTLSNALLSLLGSDRAMQAALAQGRSAVNYQRPFGMAGSTLGGAAGSTLGGL